MQKLLLASIRLRVRAPSESKTLYETLCTTRSVYYHRYLARVDPMYENGCEPISVIRYASETLLMSIDDSRIRGSIIRGFPQGSSPLDYRVLLHCAAHRSATTQTMILHKVDAAQQFEFEPIVVRMHAEYNILEKRKWRTLAEEKNTLLEAKDKEIEDLKSQLLRAREESVEVTKLRAQIDADFTRCCMRFQESFHPHLLNVIAGRRWLLTHGMKLLVVKCLNSNEYMEALGHAFGRAIEKGMQEGLAAGIEHGQAGRCLTDLEAYIPSAEDDFNSAIRELRDLNFPLLQELSTKKDASTWDIMDLLRLDDAVAETLGMTDLQPDASQLMVPVHHKQDKVIIGSQALSVALDICRGRVEKMERNLIERLPFLKGVFASIDDPLSAEALIEPPAESTIIRIQTEWFRRTISKFRKVEGR
ncbi:hypothetical protein Tco_0364893 [Tanacetum coccineum]